MEVFEDIKFAAKMGNSCELIEFANTYTRAKKLMMPDLSNENKDVKHKCTLIRAITEAGLQRFRSAFGSLIGMGNPTPVESIIPIRKRIKAGQPSKANIQVNDTTMVRITTCKLEDKDGDPHFDMQPFEAISSNLDEEGEQSARILKQKKAKRCPFPGIDVAYTVSDRGLTDLHLTVKYKKMKGSTAPVRAYTARNTRKRKRQSNDIQEVEIPAIPAVVSTDSEPDPPSYQHLVGQQIGYNDDVYKIDSVSENRATVEITRFFERDNPTTITIQQATDILAAVAN